jgi:hypothetical protein
MWTNVYCVTVILLVLAVESNPLLFPSFYFHSNSNLRQIGSPERRHLTQLSGTNAIISAIDTTNEIPVVELLSAESVHLKLDQRTDNSEELNTDENIEKDDEGANSSSAESKHFMKMLEYRRVNDSSIVLAATAAGISSFEIEVFSIHMFGSNYTDISGIKMVKTNVDMRNVSDMKTYLHLWQAGYLLTQSRDFPVDQAKLDEYTPNTFTSPISGHIKRMKLHRADRETKDPIFSAFLSSYDLKGYYRDVTMNRNETLASLKGFAVWFRSEFPYYYQQCFHCGQKEGNKCYGLVLPSKTEVIHMAGRTELYICSNESCRKTSRFARYNDVTKVLETRRGRCGEYSILMLSFLELMGYEAKWVVDWADHVWCEVRVDNDPLSFPQNSETILETNSEIIIDEGSDWVHVDPCEAAVDEPLIYQSWGKNQTYIVSYHSYNSTSASFSDVQDVTSKYTSKFNETLLRRLQDKVNQSFVDLKLLAAKSELDLLI